MADAASGTAAVTDNRTAPRGVLPRRMQTWIMLGLAVGILGIIVLAGRPEPAAKSVNASTPSLLAPNPDRLRDYQDRLRILDERSRVQPLTEPPMVRPQPVAYESGGAPATPDPLEAERKRREYESLFASNVVVSRRPEGQRLVGADAKRPPAVTPAAGEDGLPTPPSIDDVADAVVRATSRLAPSNGAATQDDANKDRSAAARGETESTAKLRPAATGPITSAGPRHRLLEGTVIETVLTNRLVGSVAAPVNCLVTTPVFSHDRQYVVIPAGSRVLGETKPVQTFGESRLAVAFNRLVLPDGRTYRLDEFLGLNDIGDAGLRDQVNQHYRTTFGASAAVGLVTGLAQYLGTMGLNRGDGDRTVMIAGNMGDSTAQASAQTLNRFLNRLPSITIREGHRVKVYLTSDLELPVYDARPRDGAILAASGERKGS
jgi:type IV secretory pathway VirB10-like protein